MNKKLPYEETLKDQLTDLPLPDENAAWEDMRKRLEEDDDDGLFLVWLRSCGLWSLVGLVIIGIGWWIIHREKTEHNKKQETENSTSIRSETNNSDKTKKPDTSYTFPKNDKIKDITGDRNNKAGSATTSPEEVDPEKIQSLTVAKKSTPVETGPAGKTKQRTVKRGIPGTHLSAKKTVAGKNKTAGNKKNGVSNKAKSAITLPNEENEDIAGNQPQELNNRQGDVIKDSVPLKNNVVLNKDSAGKATADSIKKKKKEKKEAVTGENPEKEDSTQSDKLFFSAGIGLLQNIPIAGQNLAAYSSTGRKNMLADYVPSVYFQVNNPKRWFVNIGFRYGAPQYNKEFTYSQDIVYDSLLLSNTTTSLILKKSFYHQVPLSFNFYILPHWSAGGGAIWNKFYGAVAEKTVSKNTGQTDSLLSRKTIAFKSDSTSSFRKSYIQILLQTEYNWKRFYFGIRYSFGMEPYIQFALPNGNEKKETNNWLQISVRYDIWRSKEQ